MAYGTIFYKNINNATVADVVTITDTIFTHNSIKGFYAEKLSHATFTDVHITNNGDVVRAIHFADNNAGLDVNLKFGSYVDIEFNNLTVTGNGLGSINGAGLTVKARGNGNDTGGGGAYATHPATLNGVTVNGGTFTGNEAAIRFGEPGMDNISPINIIVHNASITGNTQFGLSNVLSGVTVNAIGNWWGYISGPYNGTTNTGGEGDTISDNVLYNGWLNATPGPGPATFIVNESGAGGIQDTINAAESGDTINVLAGMYNLTAPIVVDESVTLTGDTSNCTNVKINAPVGVPDNDCFQVKTDNVTIQGFTMSGAYDSDASDQNAAIVIGTHWSGDAIIGLDNITISHNDIYDCTRGIYVYRATNVTISDNKIHDIVISGAHASAMWPGKAIELRGDGDPTEPQCNHIDILRNEIYNCELLGIEVNLWEMTPDDTFVDVDVLIDDNTIYNNGGNWKIFNDNVDAYVYRGISCNGQTTGVTISNNEIYGHNSETYTPYVSSAGIRIDDNKEYTITGNNIHDNYKGIRVSKDEYASLSGFTVNCNSFENNTTQVDDAAEALDIGAVLQNNTFDHAVTIDRPGDSLLHTIWSTIQGAVDATDDGDTVNVAAGEYEESVYIESSITLLATEGAEHTSIIGTEFAVIAIDGECSVTLDGFDISEAEFGVFTEAIAPLAEINIRNCHIHDTMNGINVGHFEFGGPIFGTLNIQGNIIDNNLGGIYASSIDGGTLYICDNTITGNAYDGIYIDEVVDEASVTIQGNEITGNGVEEYGGIYFDTISSDSEINIDNNTIEDNNDYGICIESIEETFFTVTINGNVISGNGDGIYIGYVVDSTLNITRNTITDNDYGLYFDEEIIDSTINISRNSFAGNEEYGIYNGTGEDITATYNWWGSANGPSFEEGPGMGNRVSEDVEYDPWHLKLLDADTPIIEAAKKTTTSVILDWTAEGTWPEDFYDFRYSTSPITSEAEWAAAKKIVDEPVPAEGTPQQMIIRNLKSNTPYYFGLRITDGINRSDFTIIEVTTDAVVVLDTTPPAAVTFLTASAGSPSTTSIVLTWKATGDDGTVGFASKYIIKRSNAPITADNFGTATTIYNSLTPKASGQQETFIVTKLTPDRDYYFAVQALDDAGSPSPVAATGLIHTAAELPTVNAIAPISGDNSIARTLTITGSNFITTGTTKVRLVGVDNNNVINLKDVAVSANTTQLTAVVPKGVPVGTYQAKVTNSNGTSAPGGTYRIDAAPEPLPVVTNIIPNMTTNGTIMRGVEIFGQHFTGATDVVIDGHDAISFTVNSDTKITADIPGLDAGVYDVKVTTASGTNDVSAVKYVVTEPEKITEEDTTTSGIIDLGGTGGTTQGQITLTTDNSENATQNTDVDAEISVTIPPDTSVTDSNGDPYTGTLNPPRVVKPDTTVQTDLPETAIVIEMGNPDQTINFDQDFVAVVNVTDTARPIIYYYNKDTGKYELAGKAGVKDGTVYVAGGVVLNVESISATENLYTIGLLLDHMSTYVSSTESLIPATTPAPGGGVGGGGGGGTTIPTGTTNVRGKVSSTGRFLEMVIATTKDEICSLTIPFETTGLDQDLKPLTEITMLPVDALPSLPEGWDIIGLTYDFGPGGASFDPAITLSWKYKLEDLPDNITEENLILAYYDTETGEWVLLDSTVDARNYKVTAKITHFTTFALIGVSKAAAFTVSSLNISPAEVATGETATVSVTVTNKGNIEGRYTVILRINGVKEAEKSVTIAAGGRQDVSFNIVKETAGTYSVELNGLTGSLTVVSGLSTEPTEPPEEEGQEPILTSIPPETTPAQTQAPAPETETNWAIIWGVVAAGVVIIGTSAILWLRRRKA